MIPEWEANCVYLAAMLGGRHPGVFDGLQRTLNSCGVEVRCLHQVKDIWTRDYAPVQVADRALVKFHFAPAYLQGHATLITGNEVLPSFRDLGRCRRPDIVLDGGNVVASRSVAIVTDRVYKDNPTRSRQQLREELRELLRVEELIVIPKEPGDLFSHADGVVRFIGERAVLVNDYRNVDPGYGERLRKALQKQHLQIERLPYCPEEQTRDGVPSAVGVYTNFLRTEKVMVVPVYGAAEDEVALRKLEQALPGVPLVPLSCVELAREGGV